MPGLASGFDERYALYSDGTFIWGASQMDFMNRELHRKGRWSVEGDKLTLSIETLVRHDGGTVETGPEGQYIEGGDYRVYDVSPPLVETHSIKRVGRDTKSGRESITIGGVKFYNFDGQPDFMGDYDYALEQVKANEE
jgi:hypothetical protein